MSDVDARIRGYLDRLAPGWDREGVLGPAVDAVLRACTAAERAGAAQVAIADLRTRIAAEAGLPTGDVAPIPEPCNHCNRPLVWLDTPAGGRMSVDEIPDRDRGYVLVQRAGRRRVAIVLGAGKAAAVRSGHEPLYLPHRDSCPYAHQWRNTT